MPRGSKSDRDTSKHSEARPRTYKLAYEKRRDEKQRVVSAMHLEHTKEALQKPVSEESIGFKMLKKMGWSGGSLDQNNVGIAVPILPDLDRVMQHDSRMGLGVHKPKASFLDVKEGDIQMMMTNYRAMMAAKNKQRKRSDEQWCEGDDDEFVPGEVQGLSAVTSIANIIDLEADNDGVPQAAPSASTSHASKRRNVENNPEEIDLNDVLPE